MRLRFLLGLAAVILIGAGSLTLALLVRDNEVDHFHAIQRDEALRSARQAEAVAQLSVGELATAGAFFRAEDNLTRHEYQVVGESLLRRGTLTATAYAERVPHGERAAYEARNHPIVELGAGGPQRAARRSVYYPVTYAVAEDQARAPLGYDLGTNPSRGPSLSRARDSGRPAATEAMPLLVGGVGINVFRPVYRDGTPIATVAERRRALIGFVVGVFRIHDLAAAANSTLADDVDVQLRSDRGVIAGPSDTLSDPATAKIDIADRTWLLVVRDPARPGVGLPLLIAVFGISLAALLGALVLIWSRNERMRELQREASQDPLTGLANRRRFEEDLHREIARSRREGSAGALLMLDLDNFKQVNDTLGHPAGDRVIEEVARLLGGRTRESDVLARVGGDEFAIILPNCDATEARRVGESIATAIREQVTPPDEAPRITASLGVAMFGAGTDASFETVLSDADAAMYAAKDGGRDGVRVAG